MTVKQLVGGGSVIIGATLSSLRRQIDLFCLLHVLNFPQLSQKYCYYFFPLAAFNLTSVWAFLMVSILFSREELQILRLLILNNINHFQIQ